MGLLDSADNLVIEIGADISGFLNGVKGVKYKFDELNSDLGTNEEAFNKWGQTIKKNSLAIGVAMTAAGAAIMAVSKNADTINARLGVTGLTLGENTDTMREWALSISDAGFRLDDVVPTMDLLARSGVRGESAIKSLSLQFDTLGDAVGLSANQVADSMIPAMYAFDEPLEKVGEHMDGIAYLVGNSLIDFNDLASVFGQLGTQLNGLGFSMEDTEALMLAMTRAGIPAELVMKRMRTAVTDYEQSLKKAKDAAKDVVTAEKKLADSQKDLTRLEKDYATALQKAGNTSEETARITLRYTDQMADAKKDLLRLEKDYQDALAEAQNTSKDVARLEKDRNKDLAKEAREKAKLEAEYAKDKEALDKEARLDPLNWMGNAKRVAELEERYAERRADLAESSAEATENYNDRLSEVQDTTEAVAAIEKRYATQKVDVQERINEQTVDYNREMETTANTTKAVAAVQESYADRFTDMTTSIAEQRSELAKLREEAAKPAPTKEDFITALTPIQDYTNALKELETQSAGWAQTRATEQEKQISATDRLASATEKLALQMGSAVSPASDFGTALSIAGPIFMGAMQLIEILPTLTPIISGIFATFAGSAIATFSAGIALGLVGVWVMMKTGILQGIADLGKWFGSVVPGWVTDVLKIIAAPIGSLGAGIISLVSGDFGKIFDNMMKPFSMASDSLNRLTGGRINFTVPKMAAGGIVTSPTIAMIGEAGPEAVIPLSRGSNGAGAMGGVTITGNTFNVRNDQDIELIGRALYSEIERKNRGRGASS